jgi:hypothetical protein
MGQSAKASDKGQQFLQHATSDSVIEVQLGQMAAEQATGRA